MRRGVKGGGMTAMRRRRRREDCFGMFAVLDRTQPSHLSGLDPNGRVKGQREHLRGNRLCYHTHTHTHTHTSKHTDICGSVCESFSPSACAHT